MSDTWNQIQDFKNKHSSLREKLKRRKAEREGLVADLLDKSGAGAGASLSDTRLVDSPGRTNANAAHSPVDSKNNGAASAAASPASNIAAAAASSVDKLASPSLSSSASSSWDPEVEANLYVILCDVRIPAPTKLLRNSLVNLMTEKKAVSLDAVDELLRTLADDNLVSLEATPEEEDPSTCGKFRVVGTEQSKVVAMATHIVGEEKLERMRKRKRKEEEEENEDDEKKSSGDKKPASKRNKKGGGGDGGGSGGGGGGGGDERGGGKSSLPTKSSDEDSLDFLLSATSTKEKEKKEQSEDILYLLSKPTAKEQSLSEKYRSAGGSNIKDFCDYVTKEECKRQRRDGKLCMRVHYRKILYKHTDESLGDCSFLNTCFHMDTCKYVHYEMDELPRTELAQTNMTLAQKYRVQEDTMLWPAQWVQCDLRFFDMSVLGKFTVIMADPPWDIHMELPYGTMSDDEMRKLPVPNLQDDGYIFLWVTGRAMELGRECLSLWGYDRVDEIIWVKTNQLQRIIRTGRTGHWINHGKEHCIVGVKGNPQCNRGFDCDIIVAEVRATSHKPDEIYGLIERLAPGKRKIELFGRPHNSQPNWTTLGNQVDGVRLSEPDVVKRFKAVYPDGNCMRPPEWWKQQQKQLQQKQKEQAEKFQQL